MANIEDSTMFGGKPYPNWQEGDFSLPGYQNATIEFKHLSDSSKSAAWGFLISPSSISIQHSNDLQPSKTMAGWFISKGGPALGTLSFSGYVQDTLQTPERLRFMDVYNYYVEDKQNNYMEFYNSFKQQITIEGTTYHGLIQGLQMSKSGNQHFLYQYSMTMIFYKTTSAYAINDSVSMTKSKMSEAMGIGKSKTGNLASVTSNNSMQISAGIASILNMKKPM